MRRAATSLRLAVAVVSIQRSQRTPNRIPRRGPSSRPPCLQREAAYRAHQEVAMFNYQSDIFKGGQKRRAARESGLRGARWTWTAGHAAVATRVPPRPARSKEEGGLTLRPTPCVRWSGRLVVNERPVAPQRCLPAPHRLTPRARRHKRLRFQRLEIRCRTHRAHSAQAVASKMGRRWGAGPAHERPAAVLGRPNEAGPRRGGARRLRPCPRADRRGGARSGYRGKG